MTTSKSQEESEKDFFYNELNQKNFKAEEFWASSTADRLGIDNKPTDTGVLFNLRHTARKMQAVRDFLGYPIVITSAFRVNIVNEIVGGSEKSQHLKGEAVDFKCQKFGNPEQVVKALKNSGIKIDQCLIEANWVHISFKTKPEENRDMFGFWLQDEEGVYRFLAI